MNGKVHRDVLKRRLRELKRLERKLSVGCEGDELIWDSFFDLHEPPAGRGRYTLEVLAAMNGKAYSEVLEEYWEFVCCGMMGHKQAPANVSYSPAALIRLNLPADAGEQEIKKRFRELAKRFHPDTGGDDKSFIELMDTYRELLQGR